MDNEAYTFVYQGTGGLHELRGPEDKPPVQVKAVLWVPDPEQRHGWREYYVRAAPAKGVKRHRPPMGFSAVKRRGR